MRIPRIRYRPTVLTLMPAALALNFLLCTSQMATAQDATSGQALPDAPVAKNQDESRAEQQSPGGWRRRVAILSKQSVFFPELAHQTGPLNSLQKLQLAVDESLAPSRFLSSAFTSSIGQAQNSLPGYGQGWDAYGKRFGSSVASNASTQAFSTFLLPSLLHQDPRYFVKLHGRPRDRILYAVSRVFLTRTDGGHQTVNVSGLLGGLASEGLANSYLPDNERTSGRTFRRFGVRVGWRALGNIVREYWPVFFKNLGLRRIVPYSGPGATSDKPDSNPRQPHESNN